MTHLLVGESAGDVRIFLVAGESSGVGSGLVVGRLSWYIVQSYDEASKGGYIVQS